MVHHISQLAVLGFAKEATATSLSLITIAHARLQMALKYCFSSEEHGHIREEIEEAYVAVDQASRVLGTMSAFTHQEYKQVAEGLTAGEITHLTSG